MALKCIIQFRYVTEAFSLYSDIARCLPLLIDHVQVQGMLFNTPDIEQAYTVSHAIHAHESCMHVAVRVLHSSAFIIIIVVFCRHYTRQEY